MKGGFDLRPAMPGHAGRLDVVGTFEAVVVDWMNVDFILTSRWK